MGRNTKINRLESSEGDSMKKPKDLCEIRLSKKDVMAAIELYLNDGKHYKDTSVSNVKTSQSKKYILIAEFK